MLRFTRPNQYRVQILQKNNWVDYFSIKDTDDLSEAMQLVEQGHDSQSSKIRTFRIMEGRTEVLSPEDFETRGR